jgi:hypothetical protein
MGIARSAELARQATTCLSGILSFYMIQLAGNWNYKVGDENRIISPN